MTSQNSVWEGNIKSVITQIENFLVTGKVNMDLMYPNYV